MGVCRAIASSCTSLDRLVLSTMAPSLTTVPVCLSPSLNTMDSLGDLGGGHQGCGHHDYDRG